MSGVQKLRMHLDPIHDRRETARQSKFGNRQRSPGRRHGSGRQACRRPGVLYPLAVWGRVGALESKMESSRRAGREKCLCGNGLLDGSIPPAPAIDISLGNRAAAAPPSALPYRGGLPLAFSAASNIRSQARSRARPLARRHANSATRGQSTSTSDTAHRRSGAGAGESTVAVA